MLTSYLQSSLQDKTRISLKYDDLKSKYDDLKSKLEESEQKRVNYFSSTFLSFIVRLLNVFKLLIVVVLFVSKFSFLTT